VIAYADGCTGACADGSGASNFTDYGTVAYQTGGNAMYLNPSIAPDPVAVPVTLSTASLAFGPQPVGVVSTTQAVTVTNSGTKNVGIVSIQSTPGFKQTNDCPSKLLIGASCTVSVSFKPAAAGDASGALTIVSRAANSPHQVSLSGTGVAAGAAVSLSASALDFGNQAVGTASGSRPVTLTNTGTKVLKIRRIESTVIGFKQGNDCPKLLAPGASCTIRVVFKPQTPGANAGAIAIVSTAGSSPDRIALSGNGS
jgi:hypothetical protein